MSINIRKLRKKKDVSLQQLSSFCGLSLGTLSAIENKKSKRIKNKIKASRLEMAIEYLKSMPDINS
jgi:transcriptional regulator with XRE-family HTH domain